MHSLGLESLPTMGFTRHQDEVPKQRLNFGLLRALVLISPCDRLHPRNELCELVHCTYYSLPGRQLI